jgi:hypothetical protein
MLEYSYEEGQALLSSNLEVQFLSQTHVITSSISLIFSSFASIQIAERSLSILTSDLAFIKDQITVSEVNIARLHNHNVRLRAQAKAKEQAKAQMAAASS